MVPLLESSISKSSLAALLSLLQTKMAAAYAALLSLLHTIEKIHGHPTLLTSFDMKQYESLRANINLLIKFLESYSSEVDDDFKGRIRDKASESEYIIEAFVRDHIVTRLIIGRAVIEETGRIRQIWKWVLKGIYIIEAFVGRSQSKDIFSSSTLDPIMEDLTSIIKETERFEESRTRGRLIVDDKLLTSTILEDSISTVSPVEKNTMVGFDKELNHIIDILVRCVPSRQVIPIVGMGGSGKTILAKNIYKSKLILDHFDLLAWVTISQEYNVREILLEILSCLEKENEMKRNRNRNITKENENGLTAEELGLKLHKSLWRSRYLIIMDDMWDISVWDKVSRYFPDDNKGSRIIVTTRDSNMFLKSLGRSLKMNFLDEDKSWNLFCQKTFPQGDCPTEYEEIGKKIVWSCKGLPLSIVVIGGLLGKSERNREYWEYVANDVNSIINLDDDERCMKILYLSYHHLPIHLKSCFLYIGVFREDKEIHVSELVNLWIIEGFIKQSGTKSMEEVGMDYLKDLISRNLILDHERGRTGNYKYCKIHDILRDFCLKEAQKEKFIYIPEVHGIDSSQGIIRRNCIANAHFKSFEEYPDQTLCAVNLAPLSESRKCSLICDTNSTWPPVHTYKLTRKLNIDISGNRRSDYDHDHEDTATFYIAQLINLRYLELDHCLENSILPFFSNYTMSLLWNLQILIVKDCDLFFESEFWEMSQLRHLEASFLRLQEPPSCQMEGKYVLVLENLQTLVGLVNFKFSEEVLKRIPNIKKLELSYAVEATEECCCQNISRLHKLESLSFSLHTLQPNKLQHVAFPPSLKKLKLFHCNLDWNTITTIGSLPHLELLIMTCCLFEGSQDEPFVELFRHLKYLEIDCSFGKYWTGGYCGFDAIDETYFPCLEHLELHGVFSENDIFSGIEDISTLQTIELYDCGASVVTSAKEMQEEQENNGNDDLLIIVELRRGDEDLMRLASLRFWIRKCPTEENEEIQPLALELMNEAYP